MNSQIFRNVSVYTPQNQTHRLVFVLELQNSCETVFISEFITAYIIRIVQRSILEVVLGT